MRGGGVYGADGVALRSRCVRCCVDAADSAAATSKDRTRTHTARTAFLGTAVFLE